MLTAFGPFVTDMYLPSLPSMGEYFNATSSQVQLGLTTSMIGLAVGQVLFGPLSDRYGRRRPLLAAMWLFLASTLLCLFSQTIFQFVAFRLLQGIAGAGGIVISRSVAADKYTGRDLAKMLAVIGAINGVAPVAAPIVGGVFTGLIGWKGIFCILLGLGVVLLAGSYRFRESLPAARRSAAGWGDMFRGFRTVLADRQYMSYVLQFAFAQGVLFAYIASSPFIIQQHYGYSPLMFSICFAVNPFPLVWQRLCRCASIGLRAARCWVASLWLCLRWQNGWLYWPDAVSGYMNCCFLRCCSAWGLRLLLLPLWPWSVSVRMRVLPRLYWELWALLSEGWFLLWSGWAI